MKKATGWDARDPKLQKHRADVVDNEEGIKKLGYRWECACQRHGEWTFSTADAERAARRHEARYAPKRKRPEVLQKPLSRG